MSHSTFNLPTVNKSTLARNRTFTLIEMLVVVVIIGILAGVLVPRLVGARERASDSARLVKVGQLNTAVETYAQDNGGVYPIAPLTSTGTSIATPFVSSAIGSYLTTIPTDPGKGTLAINNPPSNIMVTGDSFAYYTNTGGTIFAITSLMESKKGNTTNSVGVVDKDKQGGYQVVGKGLIITVAPGGGAEPAEAGVYHIGNTIVVKSGSIRYVIADKNAGTNVVAGTGIASYGAFFQWGNNFPFPSVGTLSSFSTIRVNAGSYGPGAYNSGTFIGASPWDSSLNNDLRGNTTNTDTARRGPCEPGYHVPTPTEWKGLVDLRASLPGKSTSKGDGRAGFNTDLFATDLLLPYVGRRDYTAGLVYGQGSYGNYWSSSGNGEGSYYFILNPSSVSYNGGNNNARGFSVRCFENSGN